MDLSDLADVGETFGTQRQIYTAEFADAVATVIGTVLKKPIDLLLSPRTVICCLVAHCLCAPWNHSYCGAVASRETHV